MARTLGQLQPKMPKKEKEEKRTLEHFNYIARPSGNYKHNTDTFYYRLSELIFGSLLASYILGFIAFAAVHLPPPPPPALQGTPNLIAMAIADAWSLRTLGLWSFAQSVLTSVLYSSFTALLYVNFHQSIVYMAIDQRKASYDFFLAIVIGITFGISLAFPLSVIFWVGLMTLFAFIRKVSLLKKYGRHVCLEVARAAGWVIPPGTSPYDEKIRQEMVSVVRPQLNAALLNSYSRVAKSWGQVGGASVSLAISIMIFVPAAVFVGAVTLVGSGSFVGQLLGDVTWLVRFNLALCLIVLVGLVLLLFQAGRIMPSKEEMDDKVLDKDLDEILETLRDDLKKIKRWQKVSSTRRKSAQIPKTEEGNPE